MALRFPLGRDAQLVQALTFIDLSDDQTSAVFTKLRCDEGVEPLVAEFPLRKRLLSFCRGVF
jgi:hypothetical protein